MADTHNKYTTRSLASISYLFIRERYPHMAGVSGFFFLFISDEEGGKGVEFGQDLFA